MYKFLIFFFISCSLNASILEFYPKKNFLIEVNQGNYNVLSNQVISDLNNFNIKIKSRIFETNLKSKIKEKYIIQSNYQIKPTDGINFQKEILNPNKTKVQEFFDINNFSIKFNKLKKNEKIQISYDDNLVTTIDHHISKQFISKKNIKFIQNEFFHTEKNNKYFVLREFPFLSFILDKFDFVYKFYGNDQLVLQKILDIKDIKKENLLVIKFKDEYKILAENIINLNLSINENEVVTCDDIRIANNNLICSLNDLFDKDNFSNIDLKEIFINLYAVNNYDILDSIIIYDDNFIISNEEFYFLGDRIFYELNEQNKFKSLSISNLTSQPLNITINKIIEEVEERVLIDPTIIDDKLNKKYFVKDYLNQDKFLIVSDFKKLSYNFDLDDNFYFELSNIESLSNNKFFKIFKTLYNNLKIYIALAFLLYFLFIFQKTFNFLFKKNKFSKFIFSLLIIFILLLFFKEFTNLYFYPVIIIIFLFLNYCNSFHTNILYYFYFIISAAYLFAIFFYDNEILISTFSALTYLSFLLFFITKKN